MRVISYAAVEKGEDWYPNIEADVVQVSLSPLNKESTAWRIGVWGDDDFGLIKDFDVEKVAMSYMAELLKLKSLSKDYLFENGFEVF